MKTIVLLSGSTWCAASVLLAQDARHASAPAVKVVQGGDPAQDFRQCRRMLVGPGVNQPDPYPGYRGFVGWQSPILLRDGTMLVGFSSGYWHASPPTAYFAANPAAREKWRKIGMPTDIDAPRGGRAELIRSADGGKTWSRPTVLLDTPWDDRAPNFCQLQGGTILCSLFTYPGPTGTDLTREPAKTTLTGIIRSFDNGRTWEQQPKRLPVPFIFDATDGPIIKLLDGSALICVYGRSVEAKHDMVAFCRSTDSGDTWELLSTLSTDHEMSETAVAQLPDGRLVLISRPEGDIAWSRDGGRSWTKPVPFGIRLFEPRLMALRDDTLLCLHGSYGAGGFRAMFSRDGGETWICPHEKWGFPVDPSVYGVGGGFGGGHFRGLGGPPHQDVSTGSSSLFSLALPLLRWSRSSAKLAPVFSAADSLRLWPGRGTTGWFHLGRLHSHRWAYDGRCEDRSPLVHPPARPTRPRWHGAAVSSRGLGCSSGSLA